MVARPSNPCTELVLHFMVWNGVKALLKLIFDKHDRLFEVYGKLECAKNQDIMQYLLLLKVYLPSISHHVIGNQL